MTLSRVIWKTPPTTAPLPLRLDLDDVPGWRAREAQGLTLWFTGCLNGGRAEDPARRLAALRKRATKAA